MAQRLSVWLDGVMLFTNVPIPGWRRRWMPHGKAWVGFTASRGWAWENHDILSWTFGGPTPGTAFVGGLDEFSLYQRALTPCEVNAIYNAGSRGKYGTNVLVCPVVTEVTLSNYAGGDSGVHLHQRPVVGDQRAALGDQHHCLLHLHQPDADRRPRAQSLRPGGYQRRQQPQCRGG